MTANHKLRMAVVGGSVLVGVVYLWLSHSDRSKRPLGLPEKIELNRDELE